LSKSLLHSALTVFASTVAFDSEITKITGLNCDSRIVILIMAFLLCFVVGFSLTLNYIIHPVSG